MKITKKNNFKPFFLYDGANYRPPPNLSFWTLAVIYFQMFLQIFKKNSVGCNWNWKVLKANKSSENNKKNLLLDHFSIWWSKKSTTQPRFLKSHRNVPLHFTCNFSINQLDSNETGKCWKQTKLVRISKVFIFKPYFLYDRAKYRPPT